MEGVARSLQDAAEALRKVVTLDAFPSSTEDPLANPAEVPLLLEPLPSLAEAPLPAEGGAFEGGTKLSNDEETADQKAARLELQNHELQVELCNLRESLEELQEERQRFFDEGIYDLVNMMCSTRPDAASRTPPRKPVSSFAPSSPVSNFLNRRPSAPADPRLVVVDILLEALADSRKNLIQGLKSADRAGPNESHSTEAWTAHFN